MPKPQFWIETLESFILQGGTGSISAPAALSALKSLKDWVEKQQIKGQWYHHRIVKMQSVPDVRINTDTLAIEAERRLREGVKAQVLSHFKSHRPAQTRTDSFFTFNRQRSGLDVWVVATIYGPSDIKAEVMTEHIKEELRQA